MAMQRDDLSIYLTRYYELRTMRTEACEFFARRAGLSLRELLVLRHLWQHEDGCLQSDICESLPATKQTVNAIVKKFIGHGVLYLTASKADRRSKIVRMTPKGREVMKSFLRSSRKAEMEALAEMDSADLKELMRLLTLFTENLQAKYQDLQVEGSLLADPRLADGPHSQALRENPT